jgi:TonB-dependent starch-binding outer membrane protein SusC
MTPKRLVQAIAMSLLLLFAVQASFAQDRTITGRVTDSKDGSPVSGATVTAKGTKVATSTAADGTYRITVPASVSTLTVTGVGFTTQEIAAKDGATVAFVAGSTNLLS